VNAGLDDPKRAAIGRSSAAAMCMSPESLVTDARRDRQQVDRFVERRASGQVGHRRSLPEGARYFGGDRLVVAEPISQS
jgi:hypothetical protein